LASRKDPGETPISRGTIFALREGKDENRSNTKGRIRSRARCGGGAPAPSVGGTYLLIYSLREQNATWRSRGKEEIRSLGDIRQSRISSHRERKMKSRRELSLARGKNEKASDQGEGR